MTRLLLLTLFAVSLTAQEIALTFDDLPNHGNLPPGVTRVDVARTFVAALKPASVEFYGFMNAGRADGDAARNEVLRIWRDGGFPLASHSYSHMDLHGNNTEDFKRDIDQNEAALPQLMEGQNWKWFRYPYLREGDTVEKRREIRAYLKQKGYRTAQVTIDFGDYMWNAPYARCMANEDQQAVEELKSLYLEAAEDSLDAGQELSRLLFDRDMKHTMLLHIGAFTGLMLPDLLELLDDLDFKVIPLAEAHSDTAYDSDPDVATTRGETLLMQMALAKKLSYARHPDDAYEDQLDKFCR
ncbi:MAG: polysaccharide deacetylase family protein [Acidobacteria bacterium]|nr:polysaccharide deacetylase family protein [Acidobacteriota bacterium]MDA1234591.1 polysaccharide deacetylase family protein [Acidobacteriota bacterium]